MLTLCAMVILSPISANIWSHHQRSSAARHIQSWARYMLARIHVDTRRSNAATYIQSHARHLAARHLATRHRAANCIRWWAIRLMVRVRIYHIRRIHLYATHIQSWSRVLLVKARLFYLRRMGLVYVAAMRVQSVIRGWRIRKRCWPRAKQIDLSTICLYTIWHLKLGLSFDANSTLFFDIRPAIPNTSLPERSSTSDAGPATPHSALPSNFAPPSCASPRHTSDKASLACLSIATGEGQAENKSALTRRPPNYGGTHLRPRGDTPNRTV